MQNLCRDSLGRVGIFGGIAVAESAMSLKIRALIAYLQSLSLRHLPVLEHPTQSKKPQHLLRFSLINVQSDSGRPELRQGTLQGMSVSEQGSL